MKKLSLLALLLVCNAVMAQITVRGVVETDYGKLNGVHIKNQKNKELLTVSTNDGVFEFELNEPSLVGFSYMGMQTHSHTHFHKTSTVTCSQAKLKAL